MTRYFVFLYDSLIHTFSVLDAGDTVSFQFAAQNASNVFEGLKAGDLILGCPHTDTVRARLLLEVVSVNADKSITLNKKAEIENGAEVSIGEKLDTLKAKSLCEITCAEFSEILKGFSACFLGEEGTAENAVFMHRESGKDCTVAQLGEILAQMCNTAKAGRKVTSVYIFGIQYGETIRRKAYKASDIISASGLNASYETELSKAVNIFDCIAEGTHGLRFADDTGIAEQTTASAATPRTRKMHPLNVILYGAPGTGKTYATAEYALAVIENRPVDVTPKTAEQRKEVMERYNAYLCRKQIVFTTFHQSYGYEDFVQGLRPDIETAPMKLRYVDGVFKSLVERAKNDAEKDYVLIIDEINRANISKVFGELITLLEEDKRMGEANALCATLPSGEAFAVPNNVYIIGTMNSADKSISLLDTALRRRFAFIEVEPDCTLIADETLRKVLERLNRSLVSEFENTDLLIGHAYFIGKSTEELCTIMNQNIIPLLYEYFYDNGEKVKKQVENAVEGLDVKVVGGTFGRIKLVKKG